MSCGEAVELFENIPKIRRILQTLCDVGLDYLTLGQAAPTLSGGEAQRVKLAAELARPDTGRTLYLLDEPTTGLHFDDLAKLLEVLNRLVDHGNTVVVIEHNLDVIKTADWVIDIGPEAGADGGNVVAQRHAGANRRRKCGMRNAECGKKSRRSHSVTIRTPHSAFRIRLPHRRSPSPPSSPPARIVERKPYDSAAAERRRAGRSRHRRRRPRRADAVGSRRPPLAHRGPRRPRRRAVPVGRPHPRRDRATAFKKLGDFADTNWNNRTIVEITAAKKSDGWFFHAITGERWLIKLKFRTAKSTFDRDKLVADLDLKPLNDIDEIEAYGHGPRVKCKNLRGPWQEVQIDVHSLGGNRHARVLAFLEQAVAGFHKFTERVEQEPRGRDALESARPEMAPRRKGFPPGKKIDWPQEMLEELLELLAGSRRRREPTASPLQRLARPAATAPQFLWNNQQAHPPHDPRPARPVGHDPHQAHRRRRPVPQRPQRRLRHRPHRRARRQARGRIHGRTATTR